MKEDHMKTRTKTTKCTCWKSNTKLRVYTATDQCPKHGGKKK